MGLPESLKQAGALANPTFFDKAYVCTVLSMAGDGTYSVVPKDTTIPTMIGIPYVGGGTAKILAPGAECLAVFDVTGAAWLIGVKGNQTGTDWVPLGSVLVSFLSSLLKSIASHTHADNGVVGVYVPTLPPDASGVTLSASVKVEP